MYKNIVRGDRRKIISNGGISILIASVLLMGGCATQTEKPKVQAKPQVQVSNKESLWRKRQQQMKNMQSWNLDGKVAMRYRTDNWTFGVNWDQLQRNRSIIDIKNPFTGATVALIKQNNQQVTLTTADGQSYQDSNAEELLSKHAGVQLPLGGLAYWARGILAPQYPDGAVVLDANGRPTQITQASWLIKYPRYENGTYNALPKKIVLTRKADQVYVNMVAKKWTHR